jgi:hypothetical protein
VKLQQKAKDQTKVQILIALNISIQLQSIAGDAFAMLLHKKKLKLEDVQQFDLVYEKIMMI